MAPPAGARGRASLGTAYVCFLGTNASSPVFEESFGFQRNKSSLSILHLLTNRWDILLKYVPGLEFD